MPEEQYEKLQDTVLSWKKRQQLGRFDPNKPDCAQQKLLKMQEEIDVRGVTVGKRCRVGGAELDRRGTVRYVGPVKEIPGDGLWVGMASSPFLSFSCPFMSIAPYPSPIIYTISRKPSSLVVLLVSLTGLCDGGIAIVYIAPTYPQSMSRC